VTDPAESADTEPAESADAASGVRRIDLMALDEVPEGTMKMAWVDGTDPVIVIHQAGILGAYQGICSHEYFELDKGFLTGSSLTCALHLSRFDLETGDALDPPAELPLVMYPVEVVDGRVVIEVPEGPLPVNE
jgi:3-phenylpropionate/trans-cinnamate dioxygenase ferredoxin subunit